MGTLNASNLTVGGGVLYFAPTEAKTPTATVQEGDIPVSIGNITTGEISQNVTYLEHFISVKGARRKDKDVAVTQGVTLNVTFDEISGTNLERFVLGSALASGNSKVMAETKIEGRAVLDFSTTVGKSFRYIVPKCNLKSDGGLPIASEDWVTGNFMIDVLYHDTYREEGSPTGVLCPYGYIDQNPALTIASYF